MRAQQFVQTGDRVAVAVSGGADSVALLVLLLELRQKLGVILIVAHFNHQLRGRASDTDEKFVAKLAAKYQLDFHAARADIAATAKRNKANVEDTARRTLRFFGNLISRRTRQQGRGRADGRRSGGNRSGAYLSWNRTGRTRRHPSDRRSRGTALLLCFRRGDLRTYLRALKQSWCERCHQSRHRKNASANTQETDPTAGEGFPACRCRTFSQSGPSGA